MTKTNVEILFEWLDEVTADVQQYADEPYLDRLIIAMEVLLDREPFEEMDDLLTKRIRQALDSIELTSFSSEDIRKAVQLAVLKGMKDATQDQHLVTPDTVALLIGYLANKLMQEKEVVRLFDPVSGAGNLLTAVMEQLKKNTVAYGSEVDPTLIQLAALNANLQQKEIEFFHQDSLRPFLLDPVDLVVADLPVGYYPDDFIANRYQLKADEGHSYSHHLLIEQSLKYTNEAGYAIFVIPEFLFNSDQSEKLYHFLQEHAHIVGVILLPESAFASKKKMKSILILQKIGENTKNPKQPMLVQMPSFKNAQAMEDILAQMNAWLKEYKDRRK